MRPILAALIPLTLLGACATPTTLPGPTGARPAEAPRAVADLGPLQEAADEETGGWRGSISGHLGGRALDDDAYWDPLEDQVAFGVEFETRPDDSPLGLEVGVMAGVSHESDYQGTGVDLTAFIGEIYAGPRLTAELGTRVRPYLGGGATLLNASAEGEASGPFGGTVTVDDDDTSIAGYAHAGVQFDVGDGFHLGADVRGVFGSDITLFDADGDADYIQVTFLLGGNW